MPTEIRHILFTPEETIRAVVEYHKRSGSPLPSGSVVRTAVEREPEVRLGLHMDVDGAGRQVIWIEHAQFAAALIFFCIQNRIPLPTKAQKQLRMINDQPALVITKTPGSDRGR